MDNRINELRAALLARGHTEDCYSGEIAECDCPPRVLSDDVSTEPAGTDAAERPRAGLCLTDYGLGYSAHFKNSTRPESASDEWIAGYHAAVAHHAKVTL